MSKSKTKSTLIRINETTKDLLDSIRRGDKGYSNLIEHLIHTYKIHARINVVTNYLLDSNFSEMQLLDYLDSYLHENYKDSTDHSLSFLMPRLRKILDDDEERHGQASKTELDGD